LGVQDAYQQYDLSARFVPESEKWMLEVYVKNATDEDIKISSGYFITENGFVATYMPPRTYGVTYSYSFGSG
jgi:outer membrane receptor protein involved in Fe transport